MQPGEQIPSANCYYAEQIEEPHPLAAKLRQVCGAKPLLKLEIVQVLVNDLQGFAPRATRCQISHEENAISVTTDMTWNNISLRNRQQSLYCSKSVV